MRTVRDESKELDAAKNHLADVESAQIILQKVAQLVQQDAHKSAAYIADRCLHAVFGDRYKFEILFDRKRGKTAPRAVLRKNDKLVDPMEVGGGVLDVIAFALRIAFLIRTMPRQRMLIVLDEPFKWLDADRIPKVAVMIETLAEELGIQFLIVTHHKGLMVGKVHHLEE